jgi:hypothetical protein
MKPKTFTYGKMRKLEGNDCDRDRLSIRENTRKACIEKATALGGEFGMPVKRYIAYYDTVGLIKALNCIGGGTIGVLTPSYTPLCVSIMPVDGLIAAKGV